MKARLPLSNKEKRRAEEHAVEISTRMIPLMFIALNDELGIGAERLSRIYKRLLDLTAEYSSDDIGDEKVKRRLEQMKIEFL
jgi:hypothetical protein